MSTVDEDRQLTRGLETAILHEQAMRLQAQTQLRSLTQSTADFMAQQLKDDAHRMAEMERECAALLQSIHSASRQCSKLQQQDPSMQRAKRQAERTVNVARQLRRKALARPIDCSDVQERIRKLESRVWMQSRGIVLGDDDNDDDAVSSSECRAQSDRMHEDKRHDMQMQCAKEAVDQYCKQVASMPKGGFDINHLDANEWQRALCHVPISNDALTTEHVLFPSELQLNACKTWLDRVKIIIQHCGMKCVQTSYGFSVQDTNETWRVTICCDQDAEVERLSTHPDSLSASDQHKQSNHRFADHYVRDDPDSRSHLIRITRSCATQSSTRISHLFAQWFATVRHLGRHATHRLIYYAGEVYATRDYVVYCTTAPLLRIDDIHARQAVVAKRPNVNGGDAGDRSPCPSRSDPGPVVPPKHTRWTCHTCDPATQFASASSLQRHRRTTHEIPPAYACTMSGCTKRFTRSDDLARHVQVIHNGQARKRPRTNSASRAPRPLQPESKRTCTACSRVFHSAYELKRHVHSFHRDSPAAYTCEQCGRKFIQRQYLLKHMARVTPCIQDTITIHPSAKRRRTDSPCSVNTTTRNTTEALHGIVMARTALA